MSKAHRAVKLLRTIPRGPSIALVCVGALSLGGCGGSSSHQSTSHAGTQTSQAKTQTARETPAQSNPDVGAAQAQRPSTKQLALGAQNVNSKTHAHSADNVHATGGVQRARVTPAASNDDESSTGAKGPLNPCTLVSRSEAQSIAGAPLKAAIEAPLGPTCIYRFSHPKADITLAVESANISQLTRQMAKRQQVMVASRRGYCGRLGNEMLFVQISTGRVLNVTAPCAVAQRLAAIAVGHLAD
jgi:hypothetical protein